VAYRTVYECSMFPYFSKILQIVKSARLAAILSVLKGEFNVHMQMTFV
jgi:hypothetical protein